MNACREVLKKNIVALGMEVIGFRGVPVDHSIPGPGAAEVEPIIEQVFRKSKKR
jgi:glutamate synthase (NADPH/NADH) large chain